MFVTRAQWGAKPSRYDLVYIASTKGVKVHYEGTTVPADLAAADQHGRCDDRVRAIQAAHLANTAEGYSDIAYTAVVCPHGYVFEGRGAHKKCGANGNQTLNKAHYAVCAMVGNKGLTQPTDDQLNGIRDAIEWLRDKGAAGQEIQGHRDGYATACPGAPLYTWVQAGAPRPAGSTTSDPVAPPKPVVDLSQLVAAAKSNPAAKGTPVTYAGVKTVEKALVAEGLLAKAYADGHYGTATVTAYAKWQRRCGFTSPAAADGIPGKTSLTRLGRAHGFTVKD